MAQIETFARVFAILLPTKPPETRFGRIWQKYRVVCVVYMPFAVHRIIGIRAVPRLCR